VWPGLDADGSAGGADAGIDDADEDRLRREVADGAVEVGKAACRTFWALMAWVRSMTRASRQMVAITPFMTPTKASSRLKSVMSAMRGG
jgi:hypothetical protein